MKTNYKDITVLNFSLIRNILICGDIHGDFNLLVNKICCQFELTDTLVVVAGDCGFGFEREGYYENIYNKNKRKLDEANNYIVFVRGNHDNPAYFTNEHINYERFMTVPDYTVIEVSGRTILCIGGAVSIDRNYRIDCQNRLNIKHYHGPEELKPGYYWQNEMPVYDEEKLNQISERFIIDTVVTHTAPDFCESRNKNGIKSFIKSDEKLKDDVKQERLIMTQIYHKLNELNQPLSYWFYGHFHKSNTELIDDVYFKMLNIMECCELYCLGNI